MDQTEFLTRLDHIESLPTLPVITRKIQSLLYSDSSNMAQIASLISKDQAISSKVIHLVNSAFFGLRNRVSSIQQGIVLLGLNSITNLVIGISVIKAFSNAQNGPLFNREHFWIHSFATAMGAKLLAIELNREEPEDYFLAGLLHDIGILIMDQFFHDTFIHTINSANELNIDLFEAEKKFFGLTHQEIGEALATKWKLPSTITTTILYHHGPQNIPQTSSPHSIDIARIVYISNIYSSIINHSCGLSINKKPITEPDTSHLNLDISTITKIFNQVEKEVHSLAHEWGIK